MKKVILITGVSSGIGKSIAQHLAGPGHIIYGTSGNVFINENENAHTLKMDISVLESIQAGIAQIIEACDRIDLVINNAGSDMAVPSERMSPDDMEQVFKVNVFGAAHLVNCVLPYMRSNAALIINIGSIAAANGLPYRGFYPASKAAPEMITESLRLEGSASGIKVCYVQPGRFATNIHSNCILPDDPQGEPNPNLSLLTPREKEIAGLICEGLTSRVISGKLFISEATVKTHTSNIYKKLCVVNKMELRNRIERKEN
jgi:NAD(P)-dependent dehydrogenase (short-subunit alcohol dehydrogenase family)